MAYTYTYKPYGGLSAASPDLNTGQQPAPSDGNAVASYFGWPIQTGSTVLGTGYMAQQGGPNYSPYTYSTGMTTGNAQGETGPLPLGGTTTTPTTPTPTAPTPTPSTSGGGGYTLADWSQDPMLLKQEALDAKMVADAQSGATAAQKTQLINYGDPTLAQSVLGDSATADAAKNNQFSTLAQLLASYTKGQNNMNEALSDHNLFYSSARVNDLTEAGKQYQGQKYQAAGSVQNALTQIAQQLLQAKYQAQQSDLNAEESAYMRALQFALANGYGSGGGSGSGGSPAAATTTTAPTGYTPQPVTLVDSTGKVIYSGPSTNQAGVYAPITGSTAIGTGYRFGG